MKILVILAHPRKGSFNHAIADAVAGALAADGHSVTLHDLCAEKFDPLLPAEEIAKGARLDPVVERHCAELRAAGGLVFVHPNWWGQPPAVLTGWIDRVVRPGVAYEFAEGDSGEGVPIGLLNGKKALVFNTTDTPAVREREVFGDPLENIWKRCVFGFCGITDHMRKTFGVIVTSTDAERKAWLDDARRTAMAFFSGGAGDTYRH